jgi:RHS repeat-associated protein
MFTGRRFDIEIRRPGAGRAGLYYYRARYYNPHIGRFMQTDPVGYGDGMNWYLYCRNNPLTWVDPSGTCFLYPSYESFTLFDMNDSNDNDWIMDSVIATVLVWYDAIGIFGEFGRMDTFDLDYADSIINPHTEVGPNEVIGNQEAWSYAHKGAGFLFGLLGIDRESAETFAEVWEVIEPGVFTLYGANPLHEYQSRDYYEGGEEGWLSDIEDLMEAYDMASTGRWVLIYIEGIPIVIWIPGDE